MLSDPYRVRNGRGADYAALAEKERSLISQRTRDALARKKIELAAVGRKLGNPNPTNLAEAQRAGQAANREAADAFAANVLPVGAADPGSRRHGVGER